MEAIRNYPVNIEFELKCPKCQNLLKIQLLYERVVIIDDEYKSTKLGPGGIRIINE
jgi:phage FluMu protein Com